MASSSAPGGTSGKPSSVPREVQVIQSVLKDMGVTEYEPAVVNQLLDFTYRYTTDILDDAKAFSTHAGKKAIDVEDTKLAVQLKLDKSYTNPPPRELLLDVASHRNSQSLPLIKPYTGPKLPPDRYCLSAMNYQLRTAKKPSLSYNVQQVGGMRGMISQNLSLVNRGGSGIIRPIKTQPGIRQATLLSPTASTSAQYTSQALASALSAGATAQVKRKLEPDDDYDV